MEATKQVINITWSFYQKQDITSLFLFNEGVVLWNQTREQWREGRTRQQCRVSEPAIR